MRLATAAGIGRDDTLVVICAHGERHSDTGSIALTRSDARVRDIGPCGAAERRGIEIIDADTALARFGDRIMTDSVVHHDKAPFGAIDRKVVLV